MASSTIKDKFQHFQTLKHLDQANNITYNDCISNGCQASTRLRQVFTEVPKSLEEYERQTQRREVTTAAKVAQATGGNPFKRVSNSGRTSNSGGGGGGGSSSIGACLTTAGGWADDYAQEGQGGGVPAYRGSTAAAGGGGLYDGPAAGGGRGMPPPRTSMSGSAGGDKGYREHTSAGLFRTDFLPATNLLEVKDEAASLRGPGSAEAGAEHNARAKTLACSAGSFSGGGGDLAAAAGGVAPRLPEHIRFNCGMEVMVGELNQQLGIEPSRQTGSYDGGDRPSGGGGGIATAGEASMHLFRGASVAVRRSSNSGAGAGAGGSPRGSLSGGAFAAAVGGTTTTSGSGSGNGRSTRTSWSGSAAGALRQAAAPTPSEMRLHDLIMGRGPSAGGALPGTSGSGGPRISSSGGGAVALAVAYSKISASRSRGASLTGGPPSPRSSVAGGGSLLLLAAERSAMHSGVLAAERSNAGAPSPRTSSAGGGGAVPLLYGILSSPAGVSLAQGGGRLAGVGGGLRLQSGRASGAGLTPTNRNESAVPRRRGESMTGAAEHVAELRRKSGALRLEASVLDQQMAEQMAQVQADAVAALAEEMAKFNLAPPTLGPGPPAASGGSGGGGGGCGGAAGGEGSLRAMEEEDLDGEVEEARLQMGPAAWEALGQAPYAVYRAMVQRPRNGSTGPETGARAFAGKVNSQGTVIASPPEAGPGPMDKATAAVNALVAGGGVRSQHVAKQVQPDVPPAPPCLPRLTLGGGFGAKFNLDDPNPT
ncbi:hypothetical protein FOA52_010076 [Chlamydomonas sp. UWO 241]|nr:hypothetical protein FOA52_010076 [Chlamydomonas sp. UWO 241]